jgi:hypothetical protein
VVRAGTAALALAATVLAAPGLAAARPGAVPVAFQGWWVGEGKPCQAWADDSQVVVGRNHIRFYAGEGPVLRVERKGPRDIVLHAMIHSEEGGEVGDEDEALRFRLSADGGRLTEVGPDDSFDRVRCPGLP